MREDFQPGQKRSRRGGPRHCKSREPSCPGTDRGIRAAGPAKHRPRRGCRRARKEIKGDRRAARLHESERLHQGGTGLTGPPATAGLASQLESFGLRPSAVHRNLPPERLVEAAVRCGDGMLTSTGSLSVRTGRYTGRSPEDRFIVDDETTSGAVDWGKINRRFPPEAFGRLLERMCRSADGRELYVFDGFVGADPQHRLAIRVVNDHPWQSFFARNLFIRPEQDEPGAHEPDFTVLCLNDFEASPDRDGTRSGVFILIDLTRRAVLIGGTSYAGEMKKAMFSVMNFLLPASGVLPMHCSANTGADGRTALFFGLSGTGKTTLSAAEGRALVGDDEHGWSDRGVFNFEGGCYAKCIGLTRDSEPQIWDAIRSGAVLENVVVDPATLRPDFDDGRLTENTRAAYPLDYINGAASPSIGGHPDVIIFLTADAFGVLPPVSRLTREGAMFHFMSGYTSKLAGTERGIKEPRPVFSECFGAPFMPRPAAEYAKLLGRKIEEHDTTVYLINTGWSGGPYGVGRRIELRYSRAMVSAAVGGALDGAGYVHNDLFNLDTPSSCPGVPSGLLDPRTTWADAQSYERQARRLARMFSENFAKFKGTDPAIVAAGPGP